MSISSHRSAIEVPLGHVEDALRSLIFDLQPDDPEGAQRVRMSNLIIYCNNWDVADGIGGELEELVEVHPARILFLVGEADCGEDCIQASVSVEAHSMGRHQQACTELVYLEAGGDAVHRLHFAVRSLLVGDLPTNLWWASPLPPAMGGEFLTRLASLTQQIVYDSIGWLEPAKGMEATSRWHKEIEHTTTPRRWRVASDLNWRRLKYWRRLLAESLNPASAPGAADSISQIEVEHGPHAVGQAWLLVAWLSHRLGWKVATGDVEPGVEIDWQFQNASTAPLVRVKRLDEGPPRIRRVRLHCRMAGERVVLELGFETENRLAIHVRGIEAERRTVTIPQVPAGVIVGRQLSDRDKDPVFRESLAVAGQLARSVLK